MNCTRATELIIDSLIEPLSAIDREALDRHLAGCESCSTDAGQFDELWQALEAVAVPEPPPGGIERLQEAAAMEFGDPAPTRHGRPGWLRLAAAILLLVAGSLVTVGLQNVFDEDRAAAVTEDTRARFLLVMTETTESAELSAQANRDIQDWFAGLVEQGILEVDTAVGVGAPIGVPPDGPLLRGPVSGMVVIRAANEQEARRIVVASPIIDYGGFIEIRSVE